MNVHPHGTLSPSKLELPTDSNTSKDTEMMRSRALNSLSNLTLSATLLIGFTNGTPSVADRMAAITAAQGRIATAFARRREGDQSEIESDAAIIIANLAGLIG